VADATLESWKQIALKCEIDPLDIQELKRMDERHELEKVVCTLFRKWMAKEEESKRSLTLQRIADVFSEVQIEAMTSMFISTQYQYSYLTSFWF